jgi:protein-S-isoprenylcysteine O-methyltransferase Ste14
VLCLAAGFAGQYFDPRPFLPAWTAVRLAGGMALIAAALIVGLAALREFHRHQTPSSPYTPAATIVRSGVFRFTRNPMYLGFILIAFGVAVAMNSLWLVVAALLLFVLLHQLVIKPEERYLSERFGTAYSDYLHETRRWL